MGTTGDYGHRYCADELPGAISPIIHVPSSDPHVSPALVAKIVPNGDPPAGVTAQSVIVPTGATGFDGIGLLVLQRSPGGVTLFLRSMPVSDKRVRREGPFVAPVPHPRIGDSKGCCTFRCTTYRDTDFAHPSGEFGLSLHHPRFLEWVGAPESAADWISYSYFHRRTLLRAPQTCGHAPACYIIRRCLEPAGPPVDINQSVMFR